MKRIFGLIIVLSVIIDCSNPSIKSEANQNLSTEQTIHETQDTDTLKPTGDFSPAGTIRERGKLKFEQTLDIKPAKLPYGQTASMKIKDIRFMQASISNPTGDYWVLENAYTLKNGGELPANNIKIWYNTAEGVEGFWTVDHRRLAAYKLAGIEKLTVEYFDVEQLMSRDAFKMTTLSKGTDLDLIVAFDENGKFVNHKKVERGQVIDKYIWKLIEQNDGSLIIKDQNGEIIPLENIPMYLPDEK